MVAAAQIRKRGGQDFGAYYGDACAMQDLAPSRAVKAHLGQGILDINGDRLKFTDWPPVFSTLAINRHLQNISISSSFQIGPAVGETGKERGREITRKEFKAFQLPGFWNKSLPHPHILFIVSLYLPTLLSLFHLHISLSLLSLPSLYLSLCLSLPSLPPSLSLPSSSLPLSLLPLGVQTVGTGTLLEGGFQPSTPKS